MVGLFTRRGFNIHSLSVGTTKDEKISRITIEVKGDDYMLEQVSKQLSKLMEVIKLKKLTEGDMVKRGLILIKVKATPKTRGEIIEVTNVFRANIVDISETTLTVEMTGSDRKIDAFLRMMENYGVEEIARTGMTALERGASTLRLN